MSYNRYTNPFIKEENKNLQLNNRMKSTKKEKNIKKESVWDRLSRVKKAPTSEIAGLNKSKTHLSNMPSQRDKVVKQIAEDKMQQLSHRQHQEKNSRRLLTPTSSINRHVAHIKQMQNSVTASEIVKNDLLFVAKPIKSVQEIPSSRSLNNSSNSLEVCKISSDENCVESLLNISLSSLSDRFGNMHLDESTEVLDFTSFMSARSCLKDGSTNQLNAESSMNPTSQSLIPKSKQLIGVHSEDIFELAPLMSLEATSKEKTRLDMNEDSVYEESLAPTPIFSARSLLNTDRLVDVPFDAAMDDSKLAPLSTAPHLEEHVRSKISANTKLTFPTTNITLQSITEPNQFINMPSEDSIVASEMPQNSQPFLIDCSSPKIIQNFQEVLRNRASLEPSELELVKDVITFDNRYPQSNKNNPDLYQKLLQSQLEDIVKLEYAVNKALEMLETKEPYLEEETYYDCPKELENLPSLQREILMLKTLGDKLEVTLEQTQKPQQSIGLNTGPSLMGVSKSAQFQLQHFILPLENYAHSSVVSKGLRCVTGVAQEFIIAQKTIVELKEEVHRSFYMPIQGEMVELQKTSFQQLKENPDILMPHIKGKNSLVSFNILEQDASFFNNMFLHKSQCNISKFKLATSTKNETQYGSGEVHIEDYNDIPLKTMLCEGGDSQQFNKITISAPKDVINSNSYNVNKKMEHNNALESDSKLAPEFVPQSILRECGCSHEFNHDISKKRAEEHKNLNIADFVDHDTTKGITHSVFKEKQHRRIRRSITPFSIDKTSVSPKNILLKTILVGLVQVSCFMLLIMAFTFPEAKCESSTNLL